MSNSDSAKGNPATKRMGNAKNKEKRARSRRACEKRKAALKLDVTARERYNALIEAGGGRTPWQVAKAARYARRHPVKAA